MAFVLLGSLDAAALPLAERPSAVATLTHRAARPGEPVELVVSVRRASHPALFLPTDLTGLRFKILRKPLLISVDGESLWLFRYRVTATQNGEYEIPSLLVVDGEDSVETNRLFLHVSPKGELPPLSAKELALGVNIPVSLSEEVLKNAPQPVPTPFPSPTPHDPRPWTQKAASTFGKEIQAFWNYPGK